MDSPRRCPCGITYDFRDRAIQGPFHFRVLSAQRADESERALVLVGHWLSGLFNDSAELVLERSDGRRVRLVDARLEQIPGSSAQRGQGLLTVNALEPDSIQAESCVLEADASYIKAE